MNSPIPSIAEPSVRPGLLVAARSEIELWKAPLSKGNRPSPIWWLRLLQGCDLKLSIGEICLRTALLKMMGYLTTAETGFAILQDSGIKPILKSVSRQSPDALIFAPAGEHPSPGSF